MTTTVDLVCFLVAVILFILAAVNVPSTRVNLMAAGLAFFALPFFLATIAGH